ncbi:hypothetical protein [Blastococcus sp. SYSU DS0619]
MTGDGRITTGLAGACVDERGWLLEHRLIDWSVRAALAADLVRSMRLTHEDEALGLDPAPVGWEPMDETVRSLLADGSSLDDWIRGGSLGLRDVVDALMTAGTWTSRRRRLRRGTRYDTGRARDAQGRTPERRLVRPFAEMPRCPADAAVLVLAWAAGIGYRRIGDQQPRVDAVLDRTQDLRWVCESAWLLISAERAGDQAAARAMRLGGAPGAPG